MQNTIFYNQPSYQIFDKSFDDPNDVLFRLLNEINGNLMCQEGDDELVTANVQLLDPRNRQLVLETNYDYTKPKKWEIFQSPCESNLYRLTQEKCLHVLVALSNNKTPNENDLDVWHRSLTRYQKEEKRFHLHVKEFVQLNKELIYEHMQQLVAVYKTRYKQKMDKLLPLLPDVKYLTHIGLPHVRLCKPLNDQTASIKELKLIECFGDVMLWPREETTNNSVDKYATIYHRLNQFVLASKDSMYVNAKKKIETLEEKHTLVLPLESLLLLLSAGDYIDLPTEMLLEMTENEQYKCVEFQLPLPSRNCGWHTNSEIVECALQTYESLSERNKWLLVINQNSSLQKEYKPPEMDGRLKEESIPYKLHKIEETNQMENPPTININKTNHAFVSWQLQTSDKTTAEESLHIITKLKIPGSLDTNGTMKKLLGCHLIKVEHKTQFGCEIMTKYELLKAWLQLTLLQSDMGQCTRLDLKNFRLVLEQNLTLEYLEQQLSSHYHVSMPHLLSNLHGFLKLLLQVNVGNYLLRFKTNHPDNFLLCSPTEIDSPNAVHLKSFLLNNAPSEFSFLMKADYLPIAHDICGPMHLANNCLPCAFPPNFFSPNNRQTKKSPSSILSKERKSILNKVQTRKNAFNKIKKKTRKKKSKKKKNKIHEVKKIKEVDDDIMTL